MKQIIHIFGASGSGTTTLGRALCSMLGYRFMDTDDYFWMPTDPMYRVAREPEERIERMRNDIETAENAVISGSLVDWGDVLIPYFTLAVRLTTPTDIRLERIRKREEEMFGERILPGGDMREQFLDFLKWSAKYDDGGIEIRSKKMHDLWQEKLACRLISLDGTKPLSELTASVIKEL